MRELALFAGGGGGILGGKLLGWHTVCAVEIDAPARSVLLDAQRRGVFGRFPIWDDITTFDASAWAGSVDVITGGFPCQGISIANNSAMGLQDSRSGLWAEFARCIREIRPAHVLVENSPALTFRGLGTVLGDLAAMGYNARWGCLCSADSGGPILRKRIWIHASPSGLRLEGWKPPAGGRWEPSSTPRERAFWVEQAITRPFRKPDAVAFRLDRERLRIIGNGQDPNQVADAWAALPL